MTNPWMDPERARHWTPHGTAGNALRPTQLDVLLALATAHPPGRILDLGCGPGEIDQMLLERLPQARLTGLDASPVMLERAREALGPFGERVAWVCADMASDWRGAVDGPYDLVVASQATHHLDTQAKRALFARVHAVLVRGGLFLLNEKIAFDPRLFPQVIALWNQARAATGFAPYGGPRDPQRWFQREVEGGDVPDRLDAQLQWLGRAGFEPVDCFWRHANQAVFGGCRA